jgi:hypothetical protein
MHTWFDNRGSTSKIFNPLSLLCWGYWKLICIYVTKTYSMKGLLLDLHIGYSWVAEPKTRPIVELFLRENKVIVGGFRSKDCKRVLMS